MRAGACLSLSGRFAPFGAQAANGLWLWAEESGATLTILDDHSDPAILAERLADLAPNVNVLFGPYSTVLMRAAIPVARQAGQLLFNHGGSGGDLNLPGQVVNVLTPARHYANPFIARLAAIGGAPLFTAAGRGTFGRHVINGGRNAARAAGITVEDLDFDEPPAGAWDLLSAGVYEDDVATVNRALELPNPPRLTCSVAAGVARFDLDIMGADGIFGIGQWAAGSNTAVDAGMEEREFLTAWERRFGGVPDYPGVQAYAAGVVASAAADAAGTTEPGALWRAAAALDVRTAFGRFRLEQATGKQVGHEAVLTQWRNGRQATIGKPAA